MASDAIPKAYDRGYAMDNMLLLLITSLTKKGLKIVVPLRLRTPRLRQTQTELSFDHRKSKENECHSLLVRAEMPIDEPDVRTPSDHLISYVFFSVKFINI
jgi:hypothetical protein